MKMIFSDPPRASELRTWAKLKGFSLHPKTGDGYLVPETWEDSSKRWRLKIKRPATRVGLHRGSFQERFSCREINPTTGDLAYYDPVSNIFGTRRLKGHLPVDIDEATPGSKYER